MKKNGTIKLAILILALTMVTMMLVSGTFAKYVREYSGTSTGTVAKFKVGEISSASLNLFSTINEVDATTSETHVASGKIAPGTGGKFQITLSNESEVDVTYALSVTETSNSSNIPIEYSTDGTTYTTAANLNSTGTLVKASSQATTTTATIYWRWAFTGSASTNYTSSQTDTTDTNLGEYGNGTAPSVVISVAASYTQID